MTKQKSQELIDKLGLRAHPEGGFYRETYRSKVAYHRETTANLCAEPSVCTAIYFMLTDESFSEMHRLAQDEVFHFYMGDPAEMLQIFPDGTSRIVTLGTDLAAGQVPQLVVPAGVWMGSSVISGGSYTLLGTTVAPGFDFCDYERGLREDLIKLCPQAEERICALTRSVPTDID